MWHVITLAPNALRPAGGNHFKTIIEKSLTEGGFSYFLPFENKPIIDRRSKKKVWRRFSLMPGYGFVDSINNFEALRQCDGVGGLVKSAGRPVPIADSEVEKVMLAEMSINAEHGRMDHMLELKLSMGTRRKLVDQFPINTIVEVKEGHWLAGHTFMVNAATGKATIKGVIDDLNGLSVEIDAVHLQAAE